MRPEFDGGSCRMRIDGEAARAFLHVMVGGRYARTPRQRGRGDGRHAKRIAAIGARDGERPRRSWYALVEEDPAAAAIVIDAIVFRQRRPCPRSFGIAEAVAEGEQRGPAVLRGRGPGGRQPSLEFESGFAIGPGEQHIGNSGALRPRKPGDHEGVGTVQCFVHIERATGDHHRHGRNAFRLQPAHGLDRTAQLGAQLERGDVALEFGIGRFTEHDDRDIGSLFVLAIGRQFGAAAAGLHRLFDPAPQRGRAGELAVVHAGSLPAQRPAARLARDIVGPITCNKDVPVRLGRQHTVVLEHHQ